MDRTAKVLGLCIFAIVAIPLLVGSVSMKPHVPIGLDPAQSLEIAESAAIEAEEWQAEQEAVAEETYYYAPTYYGGSVWYESDDEEAEAAAKEWIAWRESGGDYNATNGQYIGRYQLSADKLDGDYSEEHQEEVADAYVADRYGSWQAAQDFWESHGWY